MKYAIICLFALVFSFGCAPAPDIKIDIDIVDPPAVECDDNGCCNKFCGRYHLRSRTKKFFGRVA